MFPPNVPAESIGASLGSMDGTVGENPDKTETSMWVCLKIGYIPNDSHLIGIMISKTIGFRGTLFSDTAM